MRYRAFVTDYDGTLAHDGAVTATTIEALQALRKSDCFLIMVTGRLLNDLQAAFPAVELFDAVVAENGAVAYNPARKERTVLAEAAQRARSEPQKSRELVLAAIRDKYTRPA